MGKKRKKKGKLDVSEVQGGEPRNTMADLLRAKGLKGSGKPGKVKPPSTPRIVLPSGKSDSLDGSAVGKVVLRRERKGRGGKAVTVVEGLGLSPKGLEGVAKQLKKSLGTGAKVEGDTVVVQGEQGPRIQAWLEKQGVKRVVLGN